MACPSCVRLGTWYEPQRLVVAEQHEPPAVVGQCRAGNNAADSGKWTADWFEGVGVEHERLAVTGDGDEHSGATDDVRDGSFWVPDRIPGGHTGDRFIAALAGPWVALLEVAGVDGVTVDRDEVVRIGDGGLPDRICLGDIEGDAPVTLVGREMVALVRSLTDRAPNEHPFAALDGTGGLVRRGDTRRRPAP